MGGDIAGQWAWPGLTGGWDGAGQWAELSPAPAPGPSSPAICRYTLTEGDFHHLKNARLTHLHLPPLKIVTIHECDSAEASSAAAPHPTTSPKASLAIFEVPIGGAGVRGRVAEPSVLASPLCAL